MSKSSVVVEIDGPQNESLHFRPLGQRIRGRFDPRKMTNPGELLRQYPDGIPGQRLGFSPDTGEGWIEEPLQDPANRQIAEKLEERFKLPPAKQSCGQVDLPTWSYWLQGAVDCGLAKVVEGRIPPADASEARKSFHSTPRPDPIDKLTDAIERLLSKLEK